VYQTALPDAMPLSPNIDLHPGNGCLSSGVSVRQAATLCIVLALLVFTPRFTAEARQPGAAAKTYALLIGVTEYRNLPRTLWLEGPANDTQLIAEVLSGAPFLVSPARITTLAAWPANPAARPTRANIQREFARLASLVRQGDQAIVFMAGHGTQQPADADPTDEEPDGLDEVFLPADAGKWDGRAGRVANAIVDDDLRTWLAAIRNKGAFVWLIVDSCQSGTMARGINSERDRRILPRALGIPETVSGSYDAETRSQTAQPLLNVNAADFAALYAADTREPTPEKRLPNAASPWHGLFTYTLANVLLESRSALTYRELAERVIDRYRSEGRYGPHPMFEGGGVDREVLGERVWPSRPDLLIGVRTRDRNTWQLRAGTLHGLTEGTVLEVFPPAGAANANEPVGHVRVVSAEATTSVVEPIAFAGAPTRPERLVPGSRGRVTSYHLVVDQLRLAVQRPQRVNGQTLYAVAPKGTGPASLERAVADLSSATVNLVRRVETDADADWVIRVVDGNVVLLPASGWVSDPSDGVAALPPALRITTESDPALNAVLGDRLRHVARARRLLKLAAAPDGKSRLPFDVELLKVEGGTAVTVPPAPGGRTLRAGQEIAFSLHNRAREAIDVTLLLIDNAFGVTPLFPPPASATAGRLEPGEIRRTGSFMVTASKIEFDQVVAIAVPASTPPINFQVLAQATLETVDRSAVVADQSDRRAGSALQRLLTSAMSGGGTRSLMTQADDYAVQLIAWRALPGDR
jgi:hypothetical protein